MDDEQLSLIDRAVKRLAPAPQAAQASSSPLPPVAPRIDWRFAGALAGLIALAPLATIVGAAALTAREQREVQRMRTQAAPELTARAADLAARTRLRETVRQPAAAIWIDRVAAALPPEARVARMSRGGDGSVEVQILAPDPDVLRRALRGTPTLAFLREAGQRRSDAATLVIWRGRP